MLSVRRLHAIRDDLVLIHRGYLAMARPATQVRTLQEAKDAYVGRALAAQDEAVRRQLVGYAREFYPKALRGRLDELEGMSMQLREGRAKNDARFLEAVVDQVRRARAINDDYDEATAR